MNRNEFFIKLTGLAGFGWLTQTQRPDRFPKPVRSADVKEYTLYEGWVAGYFYYDGPEIEEHLAAGMPLQLRREPNNKHDRRAIEIYAGTAKLGYIPKTDNRVLAGLLDQGAPLTAEIAAFRPENDSLRNWEAVKVRVGMGYSKT